MLLVSDKILMLANIPCKHYYEVFLSIFPNSFSHTHFSPPTVSLALVYESDSVYIPWGHRLAALAIIMLWSIVQKKNEAYFCE